MSFLNTIQSFGTIETTRSYSYSKHLDPVQRRRCNFSQNAKRQIAQFESGAESSLNSWISKVVLSDGKVKYKVSLRVGPKLVQLPGGTHVVIESQDKVFKFLEGVISACDAGELDELLLETVAKRKASQPRM